MRKGGQHGTAGIALNSERADGGRQRMDIRHSDERTRQWSTARRLVSMVEIMTATVGRFAAAAKFASRHLG